MTSYLHSSVLPNLLRLDAVSSTQQVERVDDRCRADSVADPITILEAGYPAELIWLDQAAPDYLPNGMHRS